MPKPEPAPGRRENPGKASRAPVGRVGLRASVRLLMRHPRLRLLLLRDLLLACAVVLPLLWLLDRYGLARAAPLLVIAAGTATGSLTAGRLFALKRAEQEQGSDLMYVLRRTRREDEGDPPPPPAPGP